MKIIGLLKEYNQENAESYFDYRKNCSYENKDQILNYLQNGISFAVTMQVVQSLIPEKKEIIGGVSYFTDGYWIWPSYMVYYFEQESIELPQEFLESISEKALPSKNKIDLSEAVNFLKTVR
ncbi:hypothetical protein [Flavobacterium hungaricum]|uniref:Uncharacterized protein n=1 Tax=Flavobacterium hungaricum TaxID=2082725 RepID=A0ABR9TG77_9FLAO|nr:hypothetical protein [Flavobacterium hungaricum]MBE8724365.1 hypothetical protein [Flavobacterium hungaricum]